MSRKQLTTKQHAFFEYLVETISETGVWPTYREIVERFGYQSPNSVTQNLHALAKKGYLRRDQNGYHLIEDSTRKQARRGIPVKGIIAAGKLQEAVEAHLGTITLETIFPDLNRIYAIRVAGQSMKGADIYDGDYVLLMDDDIPNGGIGAVLYNGETSLKRIFHDRNGLRLESANHEFPDIMISPDIFEEVTILGKYVGHVNRDGIFKRAVRNGVPSAPAYR